MKWNIVPDHHQKYFRTALLGKAILLASLLPTGIFGQNDSAKNKSEQPEKVSPILTLASVQKSDNSIVLKASLKAKISGTLTKLQGLPVTFYSGGDSASAELGRSETDGNGNASITIGGDKAKPGTEGKLAFKVSFPGSNNLEAAEESLNIKKGKLTITPTAQDSTYSVNLKLTDLSSGIETPVPQAGLNVYVKRTFSNLKVGEGETDTEGEASIEIPAKLPGNANGDITLIARLDDNEDYGTLEASAVQPWGVPVSDKVTRLPRALWSTQPPIWMLITFIILMTTVWGHYIVIIFELFRLRNEKA